MKRKYFLYLFLPLGLLASLITLDSYTTGYVSFGTGCNCHGAANDSTTIGITGVPAAGYAAGTIYTLTATVTNITKVAAGIDIHSSAGTLDTISGQSTLFSAGDISHSYPKTMISGNSSFDFLWKAPASGNVTFNIVGNAINFDFDEGGDAWRLDTFTFAPAWADAVSGFNKMQNEVVPNPNSGIFTIKNLSNNTVVSLLNTMGDMQHVNVAKIGNNIKVDASSLGAGMYFLKVNEEGKVFYSTVIKY